MCAPVVQPDADDLAGPRHDRGEVRLAAGTAAAPSPRPRGPPAASIAPTSLALQRRQHVPVEPGRGRSLISPDGGESHRVTLATAQPGWVSGSASAAMSAVLINSPGCRPLSRNDRAIYDLADGSAPADRPAPSKIVAVHLSYRSRAAERGHLPPWPSYFLKPPTSLGRKRRPGRRPAGCRAARLRGRGRPGHRPTGAGGCPPAEAGTTSAWITAANDFGVYDLRYADSGSNVRSKGIDGFTPLGPRPAGRPRRRPGRAAAAHLGQRRAGAGRHAGDDLLFAFGRHRRRPVPAAHARTRRRHPHRHPGRLHRGPARRRRRGRGHGGGRLDKTPACCAAPSPKPDYPHPPGAMPGADDAQRAAAYGARGGPGPPELPPAELLAGRRAAVATATLAAQLRKRGLQRRDPGPAASTRPPARWPASPGRLRYVPFREDLFAEPAAGSTRRSGPSSRSGLARSWSSRPRRPDRGQPVGDILGLRAQIRGAAGHRHRRRDQGQRGRCPAGHPCLPRGRPPGRARPAARPVGIPRRVPAPASRSSPGTSSPATPTAWSWSRRPRGRGAAQAREQELQEEFIAGMVAQGESISSASTR